MTNKTFCLTRCYKNNNRIVDMVIIETNEYDGDTIYIVRMVDTKIVRNKIISENEFHDYGIIKIIQNFKEGGYTIHNVI